MEKIKELFADLSDIAVSLENKLSDGKLTIIEIISLATELMGKRKSFKDFPTLVDDWKALSEEQQAEVISTFKGAFDLENDKAEAISEYFVSLVLSTISLMEKIKG